MRSKAWSQWLPTKAFLVFLLIAIVGTGGFLYFVYGGYRTSAQCQNLNKHVLWGHYVFTANESSYFPKDFYSLRVNISQLNPQDYNVSKMVDFIRLYPDVLELEGSLTSTDPTYKSKV
jgi:hypothetical protein